MTRKRITRYAAAAMASRRWTVNRARIGRAWIRCNATNPCEVGFESKSGPRGGWTDTILGRGNTWEEVFAQADERRGEPLS